jgi:hypothetical protein
MKNYRGLHQNQYPPGDTEMILKNPSVVTADNPTQTRIRYLVSLLLRQSAQFSNTHNKDLPIQGVSGEIVNIL